MKAPEALYDLERNYQNKKICMTQALAAAESFQNLLFSKRIVEENFLTFAIIGYLAHRVTYSQKRGSQNVDCFGEMLKIYSGFNLDNSKKQNCLYNAIFDSCLTNSYLFHAPKKGSTGTIHAFVTKDQNLIVSWAYFSKKTFPEDTIENARRLLQCINNIPAQKSTRLRTAANFLKLQFLVGMRFMCNAINSLHKNTRS